MLMGIFHDMSISFGINCLVVILAFSPLSVLGLQTLKLFQSKPELVEHGFRGYSITGWKSAVIDVTGTKKIPTLPFDRDGAPGEIIWQNFELVPTPIQVVLHF